MNKVSIIIPVYNLESKIEQSLHSIIGQTFSDMEIVIVDDASDDNSLAEALGILRDSGKLYKIIKHEKNLGVSTSRNDGLRVSEGEYVVFVDGDDMLEKDFVSVLYAALDSSHGDYAACGYQVLESRTAENPECAKPGTVLALKPLTVACANGALQLALHRRLHCR